MTVRSVTLACLLSFTLVGCCKQSPADKKKAFDTCVKTCKEICGSGSDPVTKGCHDGCKDGCK